MEAIKEIFKMGRGPSSSHTMGPVRAAKQYKERYPEAKSFQVTLYGSLALTGKGHLTDISIKNELKPAQVEIVWKKDETKPFHPNALEFEVADKGINIFQQKITLTYQKKAPINTGLFKYTYL